MTPERLRERIEAGETLAVEFKGEAARPLSDNDLVEVVVCLANRPGGDPAFLLVGVEDDGSVTGARPRHESGQTDLARVTALVSNRTRPSITVRAELVRHAAVEVLVIEVPSTRVPVGRADGKYVRRALGGDGKPACVPFPFHDMQSWQAGRGLLDYSALHFPGASWDDLDPLEFARFRRLVRESRGQGDEALLTLSDLDLAKAIGAVEADHTVRAVRVLGLLLFGREDVLRSALPTHEVAFQVLSGEGVKVNDFLRWPLLRTMEEIEARFRSRNQEQEVVVGLVRLRIADYPERAFREAVANALIHRDYIQLGAVHVQWHDDHLSISNPGGFPEGVRLDNLLVTEPRPRNPLLADAFKRAGLVERTARGVDTIFFEQLRSGRPAPSYERSNETGVVLLLPGGAASLEFARLVAEEGQKQRPLALDDLLILNQLASERQLDVGRAAALIQKPESEARARLMRLVEVGLVEARGEKKGRAYHLSAATYRRLGRRVAYVRQRGFEPLQQEQLILQFVEKHGRITRADAAELCMVSSLQARRRLARLVDHGQLALRGERKTSFYELPSKNMDASKRAMDPSIKPRKDTSGRGAR